MGIKGRRVHMIEEMSETIISFQRGKRKIDEIARRFLLFVKLKSQLAVLVCFFAFPILTLKTFTKIITKTS